MAPGGLIVPVGLFLYGWTAQTYIQFMVPVIGTALLEFDLVVITVPVTTCLADTFGPYRA